MIRSALLAALFALTLAGCGEKNDDEVMPVETPAAEVVPAPETPAVEATPAEAAPVETPAAETTPETPAAEAAQ